MTPVNPGFRECYRHPSRVAIRDCRICGRPICKEDGAESGEPDLCLMCKQDILLHGEERVERTRKPERQTPFAVGEVTVFDDGTVAGPDKPQEGARQGDGVAEEPAVPAQQPGEHLPVMPLVVAPVEAPHAPAREVEAPPLVVPPAEVEAPPLVVPEVKAEVPPPEPPGAVPHVVAEPPPETLPLVVPAAEVEAPPEPLEDVESSREVEPAPVRAPSAKTGHWSQVLFAARYGVGIAALVTGAWMIIAFFSKQWTQVSVFTLAIAVPWALFNGTTRKKHMGVRVWTEPPPTILLSLASLLITVTFAALMEFMARLIVLGNSSPLSEFMHGYFKMTDWMVVGCALAVSFLAPFLLKVGADWSKPSVRRSGKGELSDAEADELREALEAEARRQEPGGPAAAEEPPAPPGK